jgi:RHS repeat-associated protein
VYLGTKLIAEDDSLQGVSYSHTDALGSPVARTSGTSPAVVSRTRFEPYGKVTSGFTPTQPNSIGFTGHVNDDATGLTYMQQRYYDPIAGRFLSVDPVVTDANTGKGFGLYTYVENNPYSKIDPDGRDAIDWVHGALTAASFCPSICGSAFSAVDGVVSLAQGDKAGAGISFAAAAVGIVSDAGAVKVAGMAVKEAAAAAKVEKAASGLSKQAEKGIRSLEKRIAEHEKKLADFKANPTVRPGMEGQSKEVIEAAQKARADHLEKEIKTFKDNIEKLKAGD